MDSQRVEFESEAWYRAIAEGRLSPSSDGAGGRAVPLSLQLWALYPASTLNSTTVPGVATATEP